MKKELELVVDTREKRASEIQSYFDKLKPKPQISIVHENLDAGDMLFRFKIDQSYENLVLLERKTINDMLSSIKSDGRYKEQKVRLQALQQKETDIHIYYLIEGIFQVQKLDKFFTERDRKIMFGAYIGTIIRDRIPVLLTKDFNETLQTLFKITNLIIENTELFNTKPMISTPSLQSSSQSMHETLPSKEYLIPVPIKIKKSENRTERWCYLAMLQQIQGVSEQVAIEIAKLYPDLNSLFEAYKEATINKQDCATLLSSIILRDRKLTKTGKARSLGPALSETIWQSLGSPT